MKVRVIDINTTKIVISLDNKDVAIYNKSDSEFAVKDRIVTFKYKGEEVFSEPCDNFITPKENSALDLILALDTIING